jgi:endonuclease YncB( thermonuclease family)
MTRFFVGHGTWLGIAPRMDRYGRVVAVCFKGNEDLSRWMVLKRLGRRI